MTVTSKSGVHQRRIAQKVAQHDASVKKGVRHILWQRSIREA